MYNDTVNGGMFNGRDLEELPEAIGPVAQLQEKLYVPVKEYPDVSGRPPTFDLSHCSPRHLLPLLLFTLVCGRGGLCVASPRRRSPVLVTWTAAVSSLLPLTPLVMSPRHGLNQ